MKIQTAKMWLMAALLASGWHFCVSDALAGSSPAPQSTATENSDDYLAEDDYLTARPSGVDDPLEAVNRGFFAVNRGLDIVLLRPISQVYKTIIPEFGRKRVSNFLHNLEGPLVCMNSLLQGDPQNTFVSFWRFAFNSTLGVFGLFDIATPLGVPQQHDEDFGQTLGVWGVGNGPYLVLPLFGPSNLRDAVGLGVDYLINPFTYAMEDHEYYQVAAVRVVDTRTRFGKLIDDTFESSLDPYATFRSLYLQHRHAQINNSSGQDKLDKFNSNRL